MGWIIAKRAGLGLLQLVVVVFVIFLLMSAAPGDPAARVAGESATVEQIDEVRAEMGLNRPLLVQFGEWIGNTRSTPMPSDTLRTVNVRFVPAPRVLITTPWNIWARSLSPSITRT